MATAALTDTDLRIIPLAEADLTGLERLFDEQCDEWLALLRWDYKGPSRLIREVTRRRELSGVAATIGGATIGFAFYVTEGRRCSIGDIYVSKPWRSLGADRQMVAAILDKLDRLTRLRRIESQCVSIGNDAANEMLSARGFKRFDRHYMTVSPASLNRGATGSARSRRRGEALDIVIRPWEEADFPHAARIIHQSYRGEHDSKINSQYRTEEGCAELLSIMMDHIWCGDFLPRLSSVAIDRAKNQRVGVIIASRISAGAGHLSQISVLPAYQGRGIGRRMISAVVSDFERHGFGYVSLAVTRENLAAYRLYQSCGFSTIHQFPVFYREKH
jgi:ribosomal protein S18 acetylase RimI-like enzyme